MCHAPKPCAEVYRWLAGDCDHAIRVLEQQVDTCIAVVNRDDHKTIRGRRRIEAPADLLDRRRIAATGRGQIDGRDAVRARETRRDDDLRCR
jgi:hypothetical protein